MTQISSKRMESAVRQQKTGGRGHAQAQQKALPLKFFNVRSAERFVFKRKDKRCLTQPPRCSLIPVFIHFSDFFPDLVQSTLSKCKALILGCDRVLLLKPNHEKIVTDDIVWDGPGASIPDRCWERHGTILRTLDIVQYKVAAHDRKRDLLPIEKELWAVVEPFLCRIRKFAKQLTVDSRCLDHCSSLAEIGEVIRGQLPWCITVNAVDTGGVSPTVGDREHLLHYSPKSGVFVRQLSDAPGDGDSIPLVTLPCRLQSVMPVHPSQTQILHYLTCIASRMRSSLVRSSVGTLKNQSAARDSATGSAGGTPGMLPPRNDCTAPVERASKKQRVGAEKAQLASVAFRSGLNSVSEGNGANAKALAVKRACAA